jgi:hypothetical protein
MRRSVLMLILAVGCVEYGITKPPTDVDPANPGDTAVTTSPPDTAPPVRDDTGEDPIIEDPPPDTGVVPEPDDCDPMDVIDTVEIDDSCHTEPVTGALEVALEWSIEMFEGYPEYSHVLSSPAVGQMTDDNEDGVIDDLDTPDIIANFDDGGTEGSAHGVLRWISGDGTANAQVLTSWSDGESEYFPYRYASVALGDINNDGVAEIVTMFEKVTSGPPGGDGGPPDEDPDSPVGPPPPPTGGSSQPCFAGATTIDGTVLWINETSLDCGAHAPSLADLEGDGTVEIVVGALVIEGTSGETRFQGTAGLGGYLAFPEIGLISSISDLDGDGTQEVLAGNTIYGPDGTEICTHGDAEVDGFTAVADFNGDGMGQVVTVGNSLVTVMDGTCTVSATWTMEGIGNGGPPTVADFDADGTPEIGVATGTTYGVYEADGTTLWTIPVNDESSHATGSTVFDFEGDGRPEVVYADETTLYILDGPTGALRLADERHSSRTLHEFPLVVDLDNDGQPEILVPNGGGHHGIEHVGLYALGSADGSWIGGRTTWNQHAYNIVNVNDDLSIPATPEPNWPFHNNFRSGDLNPVYGNDAPDAVPLADFCTFECDDGYLRLGIRIGNKGLATLRHDLELTLYRPTEPEWTVIEVIEIHPPILPGATSDLIEMMVHAEALGPEGLVVIVDDKDGIEAVRECDEHNNVLILEDAHCE